MTDSMRVAYTVEQCWHPTPGGTAVAALKVAERLQRRPGDVDLHFVAGRHARPPRAPYIPGGPVSMLPIARPWLYETWTRANWPKVESVIVDVDVVHATGLVPAATSRPLVVTLHDIAFVHTPEKFTRHGARVMRRSLDVMAKRAQRILCPSAATIDDCIAHGLPADKLRLVPLGVDARPATPVDVERVRRTHRLPDEFVLFVGSLEPRKNLAGLAAAMRFVDADRSAGPLRLVVAGADGWGDLGVPPDADVRFLGFVPDDELRALYAAASVFAYPSEREGFGLPILEAMVQGTPVVTSVGTSTEEVAGGAAVLVDPSDPAAIAAGIARALDEAGDLVERGRTHAARMTWDVAADATLAVYREVCP